MKTTCPRCGYAKATDNARGPDHVYCRKCGGVVPKNYADDDGPYSDDPVESALAAEQGLYSVGRKSACQLPFRGGI